MNREESLWFVETTDKDGLIDRRFCTNKRECERYIYRVFRDENKYAIVEVSEVATTVIWEPDKPQDG